MPQRGCPLPFRAAPWALTVTGGDWPGNWPPAQGILLSLLHKLGEVLSRKTMPLLQVLKEDARSYLTNVTCVQVLKMKLVGRAGALWAGGFVPIGVSKWVLGAGL